MLSIPINHNSLFKSTGRGLHFPHPCSARPLKCCVASLNTYYRAKWLQASVNVSVVKTQRSRAFYANGRQFVRPSHAIKLRGKQDPVGLVFVPHNNIFLKIKWLTKWGHQLPPLWRVVRPIIILVWPTELLIIWMLLDQCVQQLMEIRRKGFCSADLRAGRTTVFPTSAQTEHSSVHTHRHTLKSHSWVSTTRN